MSPNSVWAFIRIRHDHRQFVILDFRLEWKTVRRTLFVVNHTTDRFIVTLIYLEENAYLIVLH